MTKGFNKKRLAAVIWLAALALWLAAQPVLAHANLVRSEPAANSVLEEPPDRVVLRFTEPLEPQFSQIEVLDSEGQQVDSGDSVVDSNDPTVISVMLPELPDGLYTVVWRNVSTVDGHSVRGAFSFSVGQTFAGGGPTPVDAETPILQSPAEPVLRWLILLGALTIVGGPGFGLIVLGLVFSRMDSNPAIGRLKDRLAARMRRLIWMAAGVLLIASLGQLVVQASIILQIPVSSTLGGPAFSVLTDTSWGQVWLWRVGLLAAVMGVLALALVNKPRTLVRGREAASPWTKAQGLLEALALGLGMGVLFTLSLTSHAAATPNIADAALLNDYLHLLAVAFWVGGLFQLALAVPLVIGGLSETERREFLSAQVPRFSGVAVLSVGVLVVTGLYSAWAQVTVIPALGTPYGFTLIAKIALVAPLLLLGALNLLWVRPRLKEGSSQSARWLRRIVLGEVALAVLVLLSVGFLTSIEPARQVASRQGIGQEEMSFQDTVEGTEINVIVEPGQVGPNEFVITLEDRMGNPIANATNVRLRVAYLGEDLGEQPVPAENAGGGRYILENGVISIAGPWQVEVLVQRPDAFDARTAFRFEVSPGAAGGSAAIVPNEDTGRLLLGLELVVLGVLFLGIGIPLGGWYNRAGAAVMMPGLAAVLVGALLVANTQMGSGGAAEINPIPPTSESLEIGMQLYQSNCQSCHGASGRGDGPAAEGLDPPPADLTVHVPLHPDSSLFRFIHDGIEGTAMPPLGDTLTDEEIWHIVNYIRTLE